MTGDAAAERSVADLVRAYRSRSISVGEVLQHHRDRMAEAAPYRAVVGHRDPDDLAAEAAAVQARIDGGEGDSTGPLLGVPFTAKDIVAVAGMALTGGSRLLAQHRSCVDATVVRRLRRAGAIPIAKTNCPEFGFGIGTTNDLHGTTVNPWGPDLLAGGSSGGEAVSVALGLSPLGLGTDFGGSVRWPAQSLGVVGLRPTVGRVPRTGQLVGVGPTGIDGDSCLDPSSLQGFAQMPGFLARSVADLAVALAVTEGPDGRDVLCAPVPSRSGGDVDLSSVVIGIGDAANIGPVGDDVKAAIEALAADLAAAGLRVQRLPFVFGDCREAYDALRTFDDLAGLRALAAGREDLLTATTRATLAAAHARAAEHALAWERAIAARAAGLAQFALTPLVVLPVAAGPEVAHDETLVVNGTTLRGFELMAHCRAVSLLGAPAVSIPFDRSPRGLPLSVQVVGPPWADHLVLALARRLEDLRGGCQRPPPPSPPRPPQPSTASPGSSQR